MWSLENALDYLDYLELFTMPCGWHVALTGSVLLHAKSDKDLDIVVYPHKRIAERPTPWQLRQLRSALRNAGMNMTHSVRTVHRGKRWVESGDTKHVEVWKDYRGRRIDVIVLS